jgi:phage FluMu protein Com
LKIPEFHFSQFQQRSGFDKFILPIASLPYLSEYQQDHCPRIGFIKNIAIPTEHYTQLSPFPKESEPANHSLANGHQLFQNKLSLHFQE